MDGEAKGRGSSDIFRSARRTRQRCKGLFVGEGHFVIGVEKYLNRWAACVGQRGTVRGHEGKGTRKKGIDEGRVRNACCGRRYSGREICGD